MVDRRSVVVLGAGPCGLTAAWELAKNGVAVTVIEKEATVGGLCKTFRKDGYQFDLGGHRFISKDLDLIRDIQLLMGDSLLTRTRKSTIRFQEREYDYPLNPGNVLKTSSPGMSLQFLTSYIASLLGIQKPRNPEHSFLWWVDKNFGKALNDFFFKPYTEKLWGMPAGSLSDDWAAQRISLLNAKDAILKSLGPGKKSARSHALKYYYPEQGIGGIFERMEQEIVLLGGKILKNTRPIFFEKCSGSIKGVGIEDVNGSRSFVKGDHYLSTIPLQGVTDLLGHSSSELLAFRSLRFLNIFLDREGISSNTWMYVPEKDCIMTRIQEPKRRSPKSAPEGKTSLMLEIPCNKDDSLWQMTDEKLLERVQGDLKKLGLDIENDITGCFSTFAEHAYPCYDLQYNRKVQSLFKKVDTYENLTTLGRQGLFRYIFMDTAMAMGRSFVHSFLKQQKHEDYLEMDNEPVLLETQSVVQ